MDFGSFVLAASTGDLDGEPAAREHADAVEFRMDIATDPLASLAAYDGDLPVIATNRAAWEGGEASGEGRLETLREAAGHPAVEAVDVELAALDPESVDGDRGDPNGRAESGSDVDADAGAVLDRARRSGTAVIVSAHDFEGTPPRSDLEEVLVRAAHHGDVAKLAVTADTPEDVLALLGATRATTRNGHRVATMAMGAAGRHSRAIAPIYGSRIGYAPVDATDATAPGQYDLATLADLVHRLAE